MNSSGEQSERSTRPWRLDLQIGSERELGEGSPIVVFSPSTEEVIAQVPSASRDQVARATAAAHAAMIEGRLGDAGERSAALHRLADVIESRKDDILQTVVSEIGTPISTAVGLHAATPVTVLRWMADAAGIDRSEYFGRHEGPPPNELAVFQRPVGVVAGITAYNYPLLFAASKCGAAFAAGCPIVLLPSPQAPLSTLLFADFVEEAKLPEGAVNVLVGGPEIGGALIDDPRVAKVSFTGSVPTGRVIMKAAAEHINDVVLELGGKSATVILPEADIDAVAEPVHYRYLRNAGQGCASPMRVLVHESKLNQFLDNSRQVFESAVVGDPWDSQTLVGPLISAQHRGRVEGYISGAVEEGGTIVAGGGRPDIERGWYVNPTLISGLNNGARANQEEIFGPVGTVQPYRDVDEAIEIANDSTFGLHAAIYGPTEEALSLAERLHVGLITINGGGPIRPEGPTGGWRESGIGREKGEAGVREFLEPQTVQWTV